MMTPEIRTATPDDLAAVEVNNAAYPEYPGTVEELRHEDSLRDPKVHFERWVAEADGRVVGEGTCGQFSEMFHPRKFWLGLTVHPEYQGQGVGKALYEHLMARMQALDPLLVRCCTREDMERGVRFVADRGFVKGMREWESRLDVATFDPARFDGAAERPGEHGIEIRTLRELESDPDRDRKLHELRNALEEDVPRPEPEYTPVDFERWLERMRTNPNLLPDAYFVAVHEGRYVGMSTLFKQQSDNNLETGLTGVRRQYRRKGIALALKLRAVEYARTHGHPRIRTWNESHNRPMLSINEALGFVRQPAWVDFVKVLKEE